MYEPIVHCEQIVLALMQYYDSVVKIMVKVK